MGSENKIEMGSLANLWQIICSEITTAYSRLALFRLIREPNELLRDI